MKILVPIASKLAAWLLLGGTLCSCTPKSRIEGTVFIAKKDAPSVKLALVSISAIAEKDFDKTKLLLSDPKVYESIKASYLANHKQVDEAAHLAVSSLLDLRSGDDEVREHNQAISKGMRDALEKSSRETARAIKNVIVDTILPNLPPPSASAKTDAEGKFTLHLPRGKYFLVATSNRDTGDYSWLVPLDTESVSAPLMLSNDLLLNDFDKVWAFLSRFGLTKPNIQD